jgi:hypothetical protein
MPDDLGLKLKAPARKFQSRKSNLRANSSPKKPVFSGFPSHSICPGEKEYKPSWRSLLGEEVLAKGVTKS